MNEAIKLLLEDLNNDFETSLDQGLEITEYNYNYNKYCGYDVDLSFTYDEGSLVDFVIYLDSGLLPTPVALEIEVRNACIEFCSRVKENEYTDTGIEETERFLLTNFD